MADMSYRMMMILDVVSKRNTDGSPKDLDQIIEQVDYEVTKQSIQFTLRLMIKKDLIEKVGLEDRRGKKRVTYRVTEYGSMCYRPVM